MSNDELSFRIIFLILWAVFLIVSYAGHPEQLRSYSIKQRLKGVSKWASKADVASLAIIFSLWITTLILYVDYPDWMKYYTIPLPIWLRGVGIGLGLISIPLLVWAHRALGKYFSPDLQIIENHKLVTNGPYHWIRHPMYTGETIFMIASALESANWLVALPMMLNIAFLYIRVGREESMMIEHFGNEYRSYMEHTGRFFPRLGIKSKRKKSDTA